MLGLPQGAPGGEISLQATFADQFPNVDEIGIYAFDQFDSPAEANAPVWKSVGELPQRQPLWQRGISRSVVAQTTLPAGQRIGIYVIPSVDDDSPASDHLQVTQRPDGSWLVGWEDSLSVWPGTNLGVARGFDDWQLTISAADSNGPPEFQTEPITTANANLPYLYDSEAVDPDADPLTYQLMSGPPGLTIAADTGLVRWTPQPTDIGDHSIAIEASDGARTDLQNYTIQVTDTPSNRPPVITSEPGRIAYLGSVVTDETTQVDLRTWHPFTFAGTAGGESAGVWEVSDDGTFVEQKINADATVFLSDFLVESGAIRGSFRVVDTGEGRSDGQRDDDFIGFVFAHQEEGKFYLFDWKASMQNQDGNLGRRGMPVKVVDVTEPYTFGDFWQTAGHADRITSLYHNDIGWQNFTDYDFELDFAPGKFTITVSQGSTVLDRIEIEDSTYTHGRFGFYNFSQGQVQYRQFTQTQRPTQTYLYDVNATDPDGDSLTFYIAEGPPSMFVNSQTGVIRWAPTDEFLGNQNVSISVTDGRGGEAIQEYVLCVHPDPNNHAPVIVTEPTTEYLGWPQGSNVYFEDFENSSAVLSEWSIQQTEITPIGNQTFLGQFGNQTATLSLEALPRHDTLILELDLYILRSWDGNGGSGLPGPDRWRLEVDGGPLLLDATFSNTSGLQSFPEEFSQGNDPSQTGASASSSLGYLDPNFGQPSDSTYHLKFEFPHSGDSLGLNFSATGLQPLFDESWGVDNVRVAIPDASYQYDVDAIDSDAEPLEYKLLTAPDGATIDSESGEISWTPPIDSGVEQFVPVDFSQFHNHRLQETGNHRSTPQFPEGQFVVDGIPFDIPEGGNNSWFAGYDGPSTVTLEIPVGVYGVTAVNTLINTYWGQTGPDSFAAIEFVGKGGSFFRKELVGNDDVRDFNQYTWTNSINATTTTNAITVGSGMNNEVRLDKQFIDIPDEFQSDTLETIRFIDVGGSFLQRIFVAGITVETAPRFPFAVEVTDGRGGRDEQNFEVRLRQPGNGTIEGVKFDDLNGNGVRDHQSAVEPGLADWTIYLDDNNNGIRDSGERFTVTDANGRYTFTGLPDGTYIVREEQQTGWIQTRPATVSHSVVVLAIPEPVTVDFDSVTSGMIAGDLFEVSGVSFSAVHSPTDLPASSPLVISDRLDNVLVVASENSISPPNFLLPETIESFSGRDILMSFEKPVTEVALTLDDASETPELVRLIALDATASLGEFNIVAVVAANDNETSAPANRMVVTSTTSFTHALFQTTTELEGFDDLTFTPVDSYYFGNTQAFDASGEITFETAPEISVEAGNQYRYEANASSANNGVLSFDLPSAPAGAVIQPQLGTIAWTPTLDQVGVHQMVVRAQDAIGNVTLQPFQVTVTEPNAPPVFSSQPAASASEGRLFRYDANATDPDGDDELVTYRLGPGSPADMQIVPATGAITWNVPAGASGLVAASVIATDERGGETTQNFDLQIVTGPNLEPTFDSTPRTAVAIGVPWFYAPSASDADGETVTFSLTSGPAGMTLTDGVLQWTPSTAGDESVIVVAVDPRGGTATQTIELNVSSTFQNNAPVITSEPPRAATFDSLFRYQPIATDSDGDSVTWDLVDPPRGVVIDAASGAISWTPDESQLGPRQITLIARDAYGATDTQTFLVEVACTNGSPTIQSLPVTNVAVDEAYRYQLAATDPENETLEYFKLQAPNGLTIESDTGVITWTPMAGQEGLNDIRIGVRDEHQNVATQSFQIDVEAKLTVEQQAERANEPPRIVSLPVFRVLPNSIYEYDVQAFDPEDGALAYELTGPAGIVIGENGVVTWNVNRALDSVVDVRITVTDPLGAKAFQSYQLTVAANSPPAIVSAPPTEVAAGATYTHDLRVFDPDGDRINYSIDSDVPISIDDRGHIRWQTTLADGGLVPVTITATDSHGASDSIVFDLNVLGDTEAPTIETGFSTNVVDFGTSHKFQVRVTDNVEVASVELTFAGQQQTLVDIGDRLEAIITYNRVGIHPVQVVAFDTSGKLAESTVNFKVDDPNDGEAPRVQITSPTDSQNPGDSIFETSYLTEIHGSVQDDNLVSWTLDYTLASNVNLQIQQELLDESDIWKNIATGTTAKSDELLGTFDPTMILNNSYIIRLLAHDATGRSRAEGIFVAVTGETKIGNFRLEFTDLSLPLAGIPIEITRVYDTLQADTSGDFGFGWSQGGNDPHILETVPDGAEFAPGKTKVYLTNPEGRRVGFTYTETKILKGLLGDTKYRIEFKPDPGVYDRLTIDQTSITRGGFSGLATAIGQSLGGGVLMNPDKYTLTTKDGLKYRYDQDTGIETITDLSGNVVTFTENAITHSSGTAITFDRDDQGRIDLIHFPTTDNDGNTITATIDYDYDVDGNLIRFVDQSGKVTSYSYHEDLPHYLAEAKDNQGDRLFKVVYDEDGRYQQVIDIDDNPVQTAESPDLLARQAIVRDGNDNATTLFFDALGNVEREVDPLGNVTIREYKDPANPFLETKIIDRRGMVTERNYDARGNLQQIMELGPQDAPFAEPVVTQFTYDTGNRVQSITNAAGQTTWFAYDGRGNLTKIVNAVGDSSTFTYDGEGRRASFTDFNGNTTTFDYTNACPCGSPSKVTFADGTYQVFSYNQYGQVTAEQYFEANGKLVEQKYTYYDIQGRVTHEFDGEFTDGKWNQVRKFYDADGNLDWEVILSPESTANTGVRLPGSNNLIADLTQTKERLIAEGKSRVTDYEYDNRNRLIRQIDAEGGVAEFRYDNEGNRILLQDPVGNITTWVYDSLNRISEERDPFYWENVRTTNAAFAGLSNAEWLERIAPIVPVSTLDADNTRDPLFDDASGASCETNTPAEHVTLSCYDEEGNLTRELDRNGRRRELAYDQAGRLLEETWYAAVTGDLVETIAFTYDVLGNMLTATDSHSDYLFTYDVLNRLTSVDNNPNAAVDVPHVILTYGYDKQGNVTRTQDDAGVTVDSEYDARNRLKIRTWYDAEVADGEEPDVDPARVDMLYNAASRMTDMLRFSDLEASTQVGNTRRTYDLSGRSNTIRHVDAADLLIASYDYDYDFAGLLDFETRGHQDAQYAQTIKYQYDLTGQLTDVDYLEDKQPDEYYRYDANGNRTDSYLHGTGYETGTANQLKSDGTFDYEYDGEGNLVLKTEIATGEVTIYEYDHRNRMVRVTMKPSEQSDIILTEVEYTYDALDRRIARTANGETVHFVYNGDNVWADANQTKVLAVRYLFANEVDRVIAQSSGGGNTRWFIDDHVGSIRGLLDANGRLVNQTEYNSFGSVVAHLDESVADRFGMTGREIDSATNDYFFRARTLHNTSARFMSEDPLHFDGGDFNLYRYVFNSPTNGKDPYGLAAFPEYLQSAARLTRATILRCLETLGKQPITTTIYIIAALDSTGLTDAYIGRTDQKFNSRFRQHLGRNRFRQKIAGLLAEVPVPQSHKRAFEQYAFELFDFFAGEGNRLNKRNEIRRRPGSPMLTCTDVIELGI